MVSIIMLPSMKIRKEKEMLHLKHQTKLSPAYYLINYYEKKENAPTSILETIEKKDRFIPITFANKHLALLNAKIRHSVYYTIQRI